MKIIAYLILIVGVVCLSIGGWEWYQTHHSEHAALAKAKELVKMPSEKTPDFKQNKKVNTNYKDGEVIGLLEIPALKKEIPIVEGTDAEELKKGAGHYIGSAFPGEHGQVFIAGHRDTVFRGFGDIKEGEKIIVKMKYGTFEYKMTGSKIVKSDDRSIIDLNADQDSLVLATCYPFLFVGNAPDRYILYAEPVNN